MKEPWLKSALAEYEKRLSPVVLVEWDLKNYPSESLYICLDPQGTSYDSPALSAFLYKEWEKQGSRLQVVIGGPEGTPQRVLDGASHHISLSKLTFTHQLARLLFLEQLYRATQIEKGTQYHK